MRLTLTNILNDFANQGMKSTRKFCPMIKEVCTQDCYNYVPSSMHIHWRSGSRYWSKTLYTIEEMNDAMRHVDPDNVKSALYIDQHCKYFDAFIEWGGQVPEINYA